MASNSFCQPCDLNCAACSGSSSNCTLCSGSQVLSTDLTCQDNCPANTYEVNKVCQACDSYCATCQGASSTECSTCPSSFFLWSGACVTDCPASTLPVEGACVNCASSCASCEGTTSNCQTCANGQYLKTDSNGANTCVATCGAGFYGDLGLCKRKAFLLNVKDP